MYEWMSGAIFGISFLVCLRVFQLSRMTEVLVTKAADSLRVIGSKKFTDLEKEQILQRNTFPILWRSLLLVFIVLTGLVLSGMASYLFWKVCFEKDGISFQKENFVSWPFIFGSILGSLIIGLSFNRLKTPKSAYSLWQRMLHKMAFASIGMQVKLLSKRQGNGRHIGAAESSRAVFITGLPRAGTTILLKTLYQTGHFTSLTYKDMPFVLFPKQWRRLSKWFSVNTKSKPRPHGDGILVSVNSPEALDEVVWQASREEVKEENRNAFLRAYVGEVLTLKKGSSIYLSKNNALLNRIDEVNSTFKEGIILCLYRHPLEQAISLWKQHLHFLKLQAQDSFALEYMNDIGQNYFGKGIELKRFGSWPDTRKYESPLELNFWIEYWFAAYKHVLSANRSQVHFINYERMCQLPTRSLRQVAILCGFEFTQGMEAGIEQKDSRKTEAGNLDQDILAKAMNLFNELQSLEITQ